MFALLNITQLQCLFFSILITQQLSKFQM